MSNKAELLTEVCKKQEPHMVDNNDGGLCSSCLRTHQCIGGGVTTHCSGESSNGGRLFCVLFEQVGPGCRCQRSADCYGFEDRINVCRPTSSSSISGLLLGGLLGSDGAKFCVPLGTVDDKA
jgi:hypothetical protein